MPIPGSSPSRPSRGKKVVAPYSKGENADAQPVRIAGCDDSLPPGSIRERWFGLLTIMIFFRESAGMMSVGDAGLHCGDA
jgi:hypothetical protein